MRYITEVVSCGKRNIHAGDSVSYEGQPAGDSLEHAIWVMADSIVAGSTVTITYAEGVSIGGTIVYLSDKTLASGVSLSSSVPLAYPLSLVPCQYLKITVSIGVADAEGVNTILVRSRWQ